MVQGLRKWGLAECVESEVVLRCGPRQKKARRVKSEKSVSKKDVQFNSKMVSTLPGNHDPSRKCLIQRLISLRPSLEARPQYMRNIQNVCKLDGVVKNWDASAWLCGFAPGMKAVVAAPHHGSQFRYLAGGSIQFLAFRLGSVLDSAVAAGLESGRTHSNMAMKDVHEHIAKMGHDDLLEIALIDQNNIISGVQEAGEFLWVPNGWILAEQTLADGLCYGLRKNLITGSVEDEVVYSKIIALKVAEGKSVEKLNEIHTAMKANIEKRSIDDLEGRKPRKASEGSMLSM